LQQIESALSGLTHQIPRIESALNETKGRRREGALQFQAEAENERIATEVEIARLREPHKPCRTATGDRMSPPPSAASSTAYSSPRLAGW
jgi:hypothetical protein